MGIVRGRANEGPLAQHSSALPTTASVCNFHQLKTATIRHHSAQNPAQAIKLYIKYNI